jgi:hypothetical protein
MRLALPVGKCRNHTREGTDGKYGNAVTAPDVARKTLQLPEVVTEPNN